MSEKPYVLSFSARLGLMLALLGLALLLMPALIAHAEDFVVDNAGDAGDTNPGNGVCVSTGGGCTLRAAIQEANALSGGDSIGFGLTSYPVTISLGGTQLDVTDTLTINGPGAANLTISGNDTSRVIENTAVLTLTGVTITDGSVAGPGGGIYNNGGSLYLANCAVTGNTVSGLDSDGAGIQNFFGTLTVSNCTISNNTMDAADDGGGIHNWAGTLVVDDSYVFGNTASDDGGGIRSNFYATVTIRNTTIANNTAGGDGGGFRMYNVTSTATLENVTISGNHAQTRAGGGVYASNTTVVITNSTIVSNTAGTGGGGVEEEPTTPGSVYLANTIVAQNSTAATTLGGPDLGGTITSRDYNLLQDTSVVTLEGTLDNTITDTLPLIGSLADNGGATPTHALLEGSPAIDHIPVGANGCGTTIDRDQRGIPRPQGDNCDIGAYEFSALLANVGLSKDVDNPIPRAGDAITFTIVISNTGPDDLTNAIVSDTLPAGLSFRGPVTLEPPSAGMVAGDGSALPALVSSLTVTAGASVTVTFPVSVNGDLAGGTTIANTAEVTGTGIITPVADSASLTVAGLPAAVQVAKSAEGPGGMVANLELGDVVTYTITISNSGGMPATGVLVTDRLPLGVTFGQWVDQGTAQLPPGSDTIQWGPLGLVPATSDTIRFTVVLTTATDFFGTSITNTAVFTSENAGSGTDDAVVSIGVNSPPTISEIPDQVTLVNTVVGPIPFVIGDLETHPDQLTLEAGSSNVALVPVSNIGLGGSGANRTVTITPTADMTGTATITVTVGDGLAQTPESFRLTVTSEVPAYTLLMPIILKQYP